MGLQSNVCKEWTIDFKNFFLNSSLTLVGCTLLIHSYFFTWNIAAMNSEIVYNVKTKTWNWKIHLFLDIKISRGKNNSEFQFTTNQLLVEFLPTLKGWSLTHTLLIHSYFFTWNIASMNSEIVYNVKTKTRNWKIHLFLDIKISRGKNNSEFQFTTTQPLVEFLPTLKVWSLTHKNTTSCLIYYTRPLTNFQTSNFF